MSLINCPECKREISNQAASCPNCGFPISSKPKTEQNIDEVFGSSDSFPQASYNPTINENQTTDLSNSPGNIVVPPFPITKSAIQTFFVLSTVAFAVLQTLGVNPILLVFIFLVPGFGIMFWEKNSGRTKELFDSFFGCLFYSLGALNFSLAGLFLIPKAFFIGIFNFLFFGLCFLVGFFPVYNAGK